MVNPLKLEKLTLYNKVSPKSLFYSKTLLSELKPLPAGAMSNVLKLIRKGFELIREGLKLIRKGLGTFRKGLKLIRKGSGTFRKGLKLIRKGLGTFRKGLSFKRDISGNN